MPRANTWGGKAGEGGALHRAGIAALIAARSLTGTPVLDAGFPRLGPVPAAVTLEAASEVDDLVCHLDDGGRWYIQAKRTCGKDQHLRATLRQWIEQPLGTQDRVGLAIRNARGIMLDLGSALDKYRDGREPTAPEKQAFDQVAELIEELGGDASILQMAHILVRDVEHDRDHGSELVASMLDAEVVGAGQGFSALDSLRGHFQKMATSGGRSDPEVWITVLEQAGLNLIGNSTGRTAQRIVAHRHVITANRDRFLRDLNIVPLSLFADDLPPLPVPDLGSMHEVSFGSEADDSRERNVRLDRVARRVPKFVLSGLPGSGKTTAAEPVNLIGSCR